MNTIEFDLKKAPPTVEALAQAWVEGTSAQMAEQDKAERAKQACERLAVEG